MDCKKTIIDYLEGRIKPAELEELFETHPELLDLGTEHCAGRPEDGSRRIR